MMNFESCVDFLHSVSEIILFLLCPVAPKSKIISTPGSRIRTALSRWFPFGNPAEVAEEITFREVNIGWSK